MIKNLKLLDKTMFLINNLNDFALFWAHQKRINIDNSQWKFKSISTGQVAGIEIFRLLLKEI